MQYELKTQVITPLRQTYDHVARRIGPDKPATRYQEGSFDLQPKENFHYRPTWAPDKELYDPAYSRFVLSDPYAYTDPRQYYYTPYVTNRSSLHEAFGQSLDYVDDRGLLGRTPETWKQLVAEGVVPLRHLESGAQMLYSGAARFAYGTTIAQCCAYEGFDRIGNAQLISRVGISFGSQTATVLKQGKRVWMEAEGLQPMRRMIEELLVVEDWAEGVIGLDLLDLYLEQLVYRHLDEEAIVGGAGAYSLLAQHVSGWYAEHRKWLDALYKAWLADEEHGEDNRRHLTEAVHTWLPRAQEAMQAFAAHLDQIVDVRAGEAVERRHSEIADKWHAMDIDTSIAVAPSTGSEPEKEA